jgi:hypothetical protein
MISERTKLSTERHRERQSPNAIVRQSRQLPKDDYRIALNGGRRNLVLLGLNKRIIGSLLTEGTDCDVYQTAYRNDHTGGL